MTDTPIAYLGNPKLRERTLARIAAHREADRLIQGVYWRKTNGDGKGCAVGCLLEDPEGGHERYEAEFGIPVQLAFLEDGIFEALPTDLALLWPERFMGAIQVGADLTAVWPRFAVWLMVDERWGLVNVTEVEDVRAVCRRVADAYSRIADGETIAAREAWAAWAAWEAWAARAAREASADKLIELLGQAPVTGRAREALDG